MTTRFCVVRHGETAWNAEQRVQGQLDIPLNATGRWQARALGTALADTQFDAVVSSDLLRALETAQLATIHQANSVLSAPSDDPAERAANQLAAEIQTNANLRERHYGKFQGLKYSEAKQQFPADFAAHLERHLDFAYGSGESLIDFAARVTALMSQLAERHKGKTLLVVTHGGVLDVVHRMATGANLQAPRNFAIPNAAINWLTYVDHQWSIVDWANATHLDAARDELTP